MRTRSSASASSSARSTAGARRPSTTTTSMSSDAAARGDVLGRDRPRRRRRGARSRVAPTPASSASSMATGSRPRSIPMTKMRSSTSENSSSTTLGAQRRRPPGCARRRGRRADGARRPRTGRASRTLSNPPVTSSGASGCAEERLDRGERSRGVVALVRAVQREVEVGVRRARRAQLEQAATDREHVVVAREVDVAQERLARALRRGTRGTSSGSVSPSTSEAPGLTMPAFSRAMSARVGPAYSVWSSPTLVTTATCPSADVRRVAPAEQPDLDDDDVDGDVGEPAERRRRQDLEVGRLDAGQRLGVGHAADRLGELVVVDRLAVHGDALVDPLRGAGWCRCRRSGRAPRAGGSRSGRSSPCRSCR